MTAPDTLVTDAELAALAGISARRVRQLAEAGTLERVGRNEYAIGASIRALMQDAAGKGSALQRERTRLLKAQADKAELDLLEARGLVASVKDFERVQTHSALHIRTTLRNIPARAVTQILGETDESVMKRKLLAEIDAALLAASNLPELPQETTP